MATVQHVAHNAQGEFEPSLFGTYSKKIGMWLFLASDSLTFGALLFAYSYGRISNPALAYAVWQRQHYQCDHHDGVPAVEFTDHGAGRDGRQSRRQALDSELAAGHHVLRRSIYGAARNGVDSPDRRAR